MHSKRSREGYLYIDPGEGPPVSLEQAAATGKEVIGAGATRVTELPTYSCGHCHQVFAVQPLRTRDRPYCRGCDHYLCDGCAGAAHVAGACLPLDRVFDAAVNQAARDPARVQQAIDSLRRDVLGV